MDERGEKRIKQSKSGEPDPKPIHDEGADEVLRDDFAAPPSDLDRVDELPQVVADEHDVGTLHRDCRAGTHRHAHCGLRERGGVIHAVADHGDRFTPTLQLLDVGPLLLRQQLATDLVHLKVGAYCQRHGSRIPREQHRSQPQCAQPAHRFFRLRTQDVGQVDGADHPTSASDQDLGARARRRLDRTDLDGMVREQRTIADEDLPASL